MIKINVHKVSHNFDLVIQNGEIGSKNLDLLSNNSEIRGHYCEILSKNNELLSQNDS